MERPSTHLHSSPLILLPLLSSSSSLSLSPVHSPSQSPFLLLDCPSSHLSKYYLPVSAIEMATPQPLFTLFFPFLFVFISSIIFSVATTTISTMSKGQISCTMCSECSNPCQPIPPALPPSPPPPPPTILCPPPPAPPPPPPSSPVSDCPPPPSSPVSDCPPPPDSLQFPPPLPPIGGSGSGGGGGGGGWYPILPYFPFYYYSPPPPSSLSNSAHFKNHPIVSSIFLSLSFFYLF